MRRFLPPVLFSVILIGMAPFMGELVDEARELLSSRFVILMAVGFGVGVAGLIGATVVRIRERRGLRFSFLGAWLMMMVAQLVIWSRSVAEENAVERVHFILYTVVVVLFYRAFRPRGDASVLVMALLAAVIVGTADEFLQWFVVSRSGDFMDIVLNAYSSGAGLCLALALFSPPRDGVRFVGPALAPCCRLAAVTVLLLATYLSVAHLGHMIEDPEIGSFRSRFTAAELAELAADRQQRWTRQPPGRPSDLEPLEIEDYYRTEGGWRALYRNQAFHGEEFYIASKENDILEKYFAPYLELPNNAGVPIRLPPGELEIIRQGLQDFEPYPYVSPVGLTPRHSIWLRPTPFELWTATAVLCGLLLLTPTWFGTRRA